VKHGHPAHPNADREKANNGTGAARLLAVDLHTCEHLRMRLPQRRSRHAKSQIAIWYGWSKSRIGTGLGRTETRVAPWMKTAKKHRIRTGFALGGVVVAGIVGWGWLTGEDSLWWAASGQWIGGLGSLTAAGVAVWIAYRGWQRSDRRPEDDRSLAAVFGVWVRWDDERSIEVLYQNSGTSPVYSVVVRPVIEGKDFEHTLNLQNIGPTEGPVVHKDATALLRYAVQVRLDEIFAGYDTTAATEERSYVSARLKVVNTAGMTTTFRDSRGRLWVRDQNGVLAER
jgi:hypothetical protein